MALPPQLKAIQHHLRTAQEHEKRDPVVAYYCRLYAMQTGMKLDSKTPECRKFLVKLMDQLETMKKELADNESISQEVVGNAHIENYALKMFLYADTEDRAARFHKNMIKSFYSASLLLDVLSVFGELSEENIQHRKYARWKATYIHNCLKNGETPQAGPIGMDEDGEADEYGGESSLGHGFSHTGSFRGGPSSGSFEDQDPSLGPGPAPGIGFTPGPGLDPTGRPTTNFNNIHIPPGAHAPANTPAELPPPTAEAVKPVPLPRSVPTVDPALIHGQQQGGVHLTPEDFTKAQKLCKYAGSALQYEDVGTAVENLQKALRLLTTGKE
ncbi:vacuolar protein sorting-associated protein VTA1 homolog isoform X1 [Etheostoma spectabile]|uniref:vacuolar protein sorting-associated protein VTA1 homolog isoform X1 n=1 Tax=Etheostoma spectabile TaxID=54343 RepID=UPI0013AED871|nr:vacuolar protein sorting-associated protein VTA1 homolog isoform X1 [Etheostoma spectabile]XP_032399735.1 vacuolar protein sorting-associated protein VTA1 homolog isoform X1 [Etheostoma spectabile]XP_032399736.1 vacuolar protein sorting-associated protein VTA1 homolog isoform X1 [Etheostoma spectabile]